MWAVNVDVKKAQVYFVFEHKNFFQGKISVLFTSSFQMIELALINDWASSIPPDIHSFSPYIYDIILKGTCVEVLIPCNQGNWIDCSPSSENSK